MWKLPVHTRSHRAWVRTQFTWSHLCSFLFSILLSRSLEQDSLVELSCDMCSCPEPLGLWLCSWQETLPSVHLGRVLCSVLCLPESTAFPFMPLHPTTYQRIWSSLSSLIMKLAGPLCSLVLNSVWFFVISIKITPLLLHHFTISFCYFSFIYALMGR